MSCLQSAVSVQKGLRLMVNVHEQHMTLVWRAWGLGSNQKWLFNFCGADWALARESPALTSGGQQESNEIPHSHRYHLGLNLRTSLCSTAPQVQGQGSPFHESVHFSCWILTTRIENHWGTVYKAYGRKEREKCRVYWCWWEERHEVYGTAQIPIMLLSLALPQRFHSAVLGELQYLQFPLTLADHGFALTPFSLSFSDYILFCVLRKVWWDFPLTQVNKPCSWANRTPT